MQVNLVHYSQEPLPELRNAPVQDLEWKPVGLWVSCEKPDEDPASGDGWVGWCHNEQWGMDRLRHRAVIMLRSDANVLAITSANALLEFTHEFSVRHHAGLSRDYDAIDWPKLAAIYQGILIYPYQWSLRLNTGTFWYYSWDCASGCIWDVSCVAHVDRGNGYLRSALVRKEDA